MGRRALLCLHRQAASIHHVVWGAVPDIRLSVLPKFTLENRLPIPIEFRLYEKRTAAAAAAAAAATAAAPAAAPTAAPAVDPAAPVAAGTTTTTDADDEGRQAGMADEQWSVYLAGKAAALRSELEQALLKP